MSKKAPSTTQLLVIAGFALSCFGILLFLWITFGGPTPFKAKPYQVEIPFNEATQLAQQSDVRISGVSVGKVQDIVLDPNGKQALAKVDIEDKYGPLPSDTRAILRTKTLLGETYVELTPGNRDAPALPDGGTLPTAQVAESVQLDEIFRTFNPRTRAAFQSWQQEAAGSIAGEGANLSYGFAQLEPAFVQFDRLFRVLDSQRLAVKQVFSNGATALSALRGRQGELATLIQNSNEVFSTTAARAQDIEAAFRAFPTFEDESRLTLERLRSFSEDATPTIQQLIPVAEQLSPTLISLSKFAPQAKGFFEGLKPVVKRAPKAFPALRKLFRDQFPPLLRAVDPFLRNLNPFIAGIGLYKHELTAAMANVASMSNPFLTVENKRGEHTHYLRVMGPGSPESLATFPTRTTTNRTNAYAQPLAYEQLASGLPVFDDRGCVSGVTATLDEASTVNDPAFYERAETKAEHEEPLAEREKKAKEKAEELHETFKGFTVPAVKFFKTLMKYAYASQAKSANSATVPAPSCTQQSPFNPVGRPGAATTYQHFYEQSE